MFDEIEIPLVPVLADMEKKGIRLDVEFLKSMSVDMQKKSMHWNNKFMKLLVRNSIWLLQNSWAIFYSKTKIGGRNKEN